MQQSRMKNATKNVFSGVLNRIITSILPFFVRTAMIYTLGGEFLGLNVLFTSILQVLNVAEMGLSEVIVFSLYKPIENNDSERICNLMAFYKKAYTIIGFVIFSVGCILMPFLPFLIMGDIPQNINLYVLFLIFLLNTSLSYWMFSYKSVLLVAHQRYNVVTNVTTIMTILQNAFQLMILFLMRNYYGYVILFPLFTVLRNIYIAKVVDRNYPQYLLRGKLEKESITDIRKSISAIIIGRIGDISRNSLNSIIISSYLGLIAVAIYGNYFYIYAMLYGLMGTITISLQAGVGNSIASESVDKNYDDFRFLTFLFAWISMVITALLLVLYQPFMIIWVGDELLLSNMDMVLFCIYFYACAMTCARNLYMNGTALWWRAKKWFIIEAVFNLLLNLIFGRIWGITGILLATIFTVTAINFVGRSIVVFDYYFTDMKISDFLKQNLLYAISAAFVCGITYHICIYIAVSNIYIHLIVLVLACITISNLIYLALYKKTSYFRRALQLLNRIRPMFRY